MRNLELMSMQSKVSRISIYLSLLFFISNFGIKNVLSEDLYLNENTNFENTDLSFDNIYIYAWWDSENIQVDQVNSKINAYNDLRISSPTRKDVDGIKSFYGPDSSYGTGYVQYNLHEVSNATSSLNSGNMIVGYGSRGLVNHIGEINTTGNLSVGQVMDWIYINVDIKDFSHFFIGTGTYNLKGGNLNSNNEWIGNGGNGTFNQSGGDHKVSLLSVGMESNLPDRISGVNRIVNQALIGR